MKIGICTVVAEPYRIPRTVGIPSLSVGFLTGCLSRSLLVDAGTGLTKSPVPYILRCGIILMDAGFAPLPPQRSGGTDEFPVGIQCMRWPSMPSIEIKYQIWYDPADSDNTRLSVTALGDVSVLADTPGGCLSIRRIPENTHFMCPRGGLGRFRAVPQIGAGGSLPQIV